MRVIGGAAKGRQLKSPTSTGTRPIIDRVKTALFDTLGDRVEDARVLDLFGGVGSVGIEALSRGARHATFIELSAPIATILRDNLETTRLADRATVVRGDAFHFIETTAATEQRFDLIYVAPPQYEGLAGKAFAAIDAIPLTTAGGLIIVQVHPKERQDLVALLPRNHRLRDERRYGSTLLLFYDALA